MDAEEVSAKVKIESDSIKDENPGSPIQDVKNEDSENVKNLKIEAGQEEAGRTSQKPKKTVNVESSGNEANFEEEFRKTRRGNTNRKREKKRKLIQKKRLKLKTFRNNDSSSRSLKFVRKSLCQENQKERNACFRKLENLESEREKWVAKKVINLVDFKNPKRDRMKKKKRARRLVKAGGRNKLKLESNMDSVTISSGSEIDEDVECFKKNQKIVKVETSSVDQTFATSRHSKSRIYEDAMNAEKGSFGDKQGEQELPANPQPQDLNVRPPEFFNGMGAGSKLGVEDGTKMIDQCKKMNFGGLGMGCPGDSGMKSMGAGYLMQKTKMGFDSQPIGQSKGSYKYPGNLLKNAAITPGLMEHIQQGIDPQYRYNSYVIQLQKNKGLGTLQEGEKLQEVKINRNLSQLKNMEIGFEEEFRNQISELSEVEEEEREAPNTGKPEKIKIIFSKTPLGSFGSRKEEIKAHIRKNKKYFKPNGLRERKRRLGKALLTSKQTGQYKRKKKFRKNTAGLIQYSDVLSCALVNKQNNQLTNKKPSNKFSNQSNSEKYEKSEDDSSQFEKFRNYSDKKTSNHFEKTDKKYGTDYDYYINNSQKLKEKLIQSKQDKGKKVYNLNVKKYQAQARQRRSVFEEEYTNDVTTNTSGVNSDRENEEHLVEDNLFYDAKTKKYIDLKKIQEGSPFVCRHLSQETPNTRKCNSASQNLFCDIINIFYYTRNLGFDKDVKNHRFSEIEKYFPPVVLDAKSNKVSPNIKLKNKCFCRHNNLKKTKRIKKNKNHVFQTHKKVKKITDVKTIKKNNKEKKIIPIRNLEKSDTLSKDADFEDKEKEDIFREDFMPRFQKLKLPLYTFKKLPMISKTTEEFIEQLSSEKNDDLQIISSGSVIKKKKKLSILIQDMHLNMNSKIQRFFVKVKQVDSFMMEKMFAGKWEICVLEMNKLFESKKKIQEYFSFIQALDEDFYWLFLKSNDDGDSQSM